MKTPSLATCEQSDNQALVVQNSKKEPNDAQNLIGNPPYHLSYTKGAITWPLGSSAAPTYKVAYHAGSSERVGEWLVHKKNVIFLSSNTQNPGTHLELCTSRK